MKFYILCIIFVPQLYVVRSDRSLDDYLRQTVNNIKVMMPTGDPSIGIPPLDPYRMNDIITNTSNRRVKISLKLQNLVLTGASKFNVERLHVNLGNFSLKVDVLFEELKMTGQYDVKGTVWSFIPIYGNGKAMIKIKGFRIKATIGININSSNGRMKIVTFDMNLDFGEAQMNLENILGGGGLGKLVNMLANSLLRPMFRKNKSKIEGLIKAAVTKILEKRLKNVDIRKFMTTIPIRSKRSVRSINISDADEYIDRLLNNAKSDPSLSIDPLNFPDESDRRARYRIVGGVVYGLKSTHRVGNMVIDCAKSTSKCLFSGEIGFNNIRAIIHTRLRWLFFRSRPSFDIRVREMRAKFAIHLNINGGRGEAASLQSFQISRFSTPRVRILKSGILGWIVSLVSRLVVRFWRNQIIRRIEGFLKEAIVKSLSKVSLQFL